MKVLRSNLIRWGTLLFLLALPLGTKKFLFSFGTPFSNSYTSEYDSAFLFGTDILLIGLLLLSGRGFFAQLKEWFRQYKRPAVFLILFLVLSLFSVLLAGYGYFAVYSFGRLALGVLAALMIGAALKSDIIRFREVAAAISLAAVFEAVLGFLQFILQKSVGLWFLGETVFGPGTPGIARITVDGVGFARAYGTMPHANILAGFLTLGLLALFYLFLREERLNFKYSEVAGIFVILAGLFLTFSRSGWITVAVATVLFIIWELLADKERRIKVVYLISVLLASCVLLFVILGWAISSRAHFSADEGPVRDRWSYDKIGVELILSHPLGVGIGNELFYAYQKKGLFENYGLNSPGQWQPIHNLYLMVSSETGIVGLIGFLAFIASLILLAIRSLGLGPPPQWRRYEERSEEDDEGGNIRITTIMLAALLLFGLFDHFLWDLQLGRLMLWVVIGILLGVRSRRNKPS